MFVQAAPASGRKDVKSGRGTPRQVETVPIVLPDEDSLTANTGETQVSNDPSHDPLKYFDVLGQYITTYSRAATDLTVHLVYGRQLFKTKGKDGGLDRPKVLAEFNKKDGHLERIR